MTVPPLTEQECDGFYDACRYNWLDAVEEMITDYPALLQRPDDTARAARFGTTGQNGLFYAAEAGHLDIATFLLAQGAAVDANTPEKWTPFWAAAGGGHLDMMRLLKSYGADINATDENGWTPLMVACWNGENESTNLLLDMGADIWLRNHKGETAAEMFRTPSTSRLVKAAQEQVLITTGAQDDIQPIRPITFKPKPARP